jgi:hypothetical protein
MCFYFHGRVLVSTDVSIVDRNEQPLLETIFAERLETSF